jgi:small-conductance mechanosensitive channel
MEIDRMFREHGIEIAFPQHDIHVRTMTGWNATPAIFNQESESDKERKAA